MKNVKCINCGNMIEADLKEKYITCKHCGIMFESESISLNDNFDFEKNIKEERIKDLKVRESAEIAGKVVGIIISIITILIITIFTKFIV